MAIAGLLSLSFLASISTDSAYAKRGRGTEIEVEDLRGREFEFENHTRHQGWDDGFSHHTEDSLRGGEDEPHHYWFHH